ncbi:hypothetical protein JYK14_24985 [Siccirubricoccus sp. KC 17139]|uniref:Uncharacterized protein n=1 Tax=Siccirubricoccus soli TaxID=2899147 RepID=A0ABT1DBS1_9PROT|nr:hypothetical protein [Siccirubricoccus soli]MCO6419392.1 hypothetical protein [Siccirubricoccus soli]MCP2685527.1 hypothetical protein [Siccirubricoccus soli]
MTLPARLSLAGLALLLALPARAEEGVTLFKVVGPRDEVTIGLTAAELARLGSGPGVERLARALVAEGQITAWRYAVGRAADGSTRYAARDRVTILRQETLRIEPYRAALPVAPPPTE